MDAWMYLNSIIAGNVCYYGLTGSGNSDGMLVASLLPWFLMVSFACKRLSEYLGWYIQGLGTWRAML